MSFAEIIFYAFAVLAVGSGLAVISARNPVHSVLFLILCFVSASGLFILIGAEYIAMTLIIVYVGAVAVLLLFVVMMLNVNLAEVRQGFVKRLAVSVFFAGALLAQILFVFNQALNSKAAPAPAAQPIPNLAAADNTEALGQVLYTDYAAIFIISSFILLVAMIGAIILTMRTREGFKKVSVPEQNARVRKDSIRLVNVKSGTSQEIAKKASKALPSKGEAA
jgi:NADH-quinone oxidoreductase subunit J